MMDSGRKIWFMGKGKWCILMEMYLRGYDNLGREMEKVCIRIKKI